MAHFPRATQRLRNIQPQSFANYAPANYRIDGHAPTVDPDLGMSAPHDFSGFDNFFHPQPKTAPAKTASATTPAPSRATIGPSTIKAAPADINGGVVQGLLDRAAGVTTPASPQSQPPNPGAVARQTGEQQQTQYGTVGVNRVNGVADGTPIMENGVQTGIAGNPVQGPPAPSAADQARSLVAARSTTLNRFPAIAQAGTPENAAFVTFAKSTNPETGQPYGEAGAHANLDKLMKPFLVGPPTPTESDVAASRYAQQKADQAKAAAGNFDPNSKLGKAAIAINTAPGPVDWAKAEANKLAKAAGYQKPLFTIPDTKPYTAINPNDSDIRDDQEYLKNLPPGAGEEHFTNGRYDPSKDPEEATPTMAPDESKAIAQRAQTSLPMDHDDDAPAPLIAPSKPAPSTPSAPSGDTLDQKLANLNDAQNMEDAKNGEQLQTPNYARGFIPKRKTLSMVPNYATGAYGGTSDSMGGSGDPDEINLPNNMARANSVDNRLRTPGDQSYPITPQPTSAPTNAERAEAASWKGNMQSAQGALENYDKQYGNGQQAITTQQLAGPDGPIATVPGKTPNYARGLQPDRKTLSLMPSYAKGMKPAIAREKQAIKKGVGGAPKSAKPMPVMLAGKPAVINDSEQVASTPAGPAVLNRNQQAAMPDRKTLSIPTMATGAVMIKPSHRGRLHRALNVPLSEKIPASRIAAAKNSTNPHMRKMATFAQNFAH